MVALNYLVKSVSLPNTVAQGNSSCNMAIAFCPFFIAARDNVPIK